jgi:hypothetical protein
VLDARGAVAGRHGRRIGIERAVFAGVVKHPAAVVVDETFRRRTLGQQHVVAVQFQMKILHRLHPIELHDAAPVHQRHRRHQHAVQEQRVLGRDEQVALRHPVRQRPGRDADGQHAPVAGDERAPVAAPADPAQRPDGTGRRHQPVADAQILDRNFPALGKDQRAPGIAGDDDVGAGVAVGDQVEHLPRLHPDQFQIERSGAVRNCQRVVVAQRGGGAGAEHVRDVDRVALGEA